MVEVAEASLKEGRGIEGDRFFDYKEGYKGQVTFFEYETFLDLRERFGVFDRGVEVFRRNIIVEGIDLNSLIGKKFEAQGIQFQGIEEAKPCYWMEQAFCPGAEEALKGKGGLRAQILSSGTLKVAPPPVA
jgi:MOSC domain-containing protein YiiM